MKYLHHFFNVLRLLLIVLFIYTATSKIIGYYIFYEQLTKIPLLQSQAVFLSYFVPIAEIITAILLVPAKTEILGWWLYALSLSCFVLYISLIMLFAPKLPCSCGGIISQLTWKQHLFFNIFLAAACWGRLYHYYFFTKFSMHTKGVS